MTQINYLSDSILKLTGQDVDLRDLLLQTNANIVLKIFFNKRFDLDDHFLKDYIQKWKDWIAAEGGSRALVMIHTPVWLSKLFARKIIPRTVETTEILKDFVRQEVNEHLRTLDKDNPRDFIDMYAVSKGEELDLDQLINNAVFLCIDPIMTVGYALQWVFLYLTLYQDVQKKMQDEMDKVWYLNYTCTSQFRLHFDTVDTTLLYEMTATVTTLEPTTRQKASKQ